MDNFASPDISPADSSSDASEDELVPARGRTLAKSPSRRENERADRPSRIYQDPDCSVLVHHTSPYLPQEENFRTESSCISSPSKGEQPRILLSSPGNTIRSKRAVSTSQCTRNKDTPFRKKLICERNVSGRFNKEVSQRGTDKSTSPVRSVRFADLANL